MQDGAAERGLHALALGKAGRAPVRNGLQAEGDKHLAHPLGEDRGRHPAKHAEVRQVLAHGEPGIDSHVVEQGAQAALRDQWIAGRGGIGIGTGIV